MEVDVFKEAEHPAELEKRLCENDLLDVRALLVLVEEMVRDGKVEGECPSSEDDELRQLEEALRIERRRSRLLAQALSLAIDRYNVALESEGLLRGELSQKLAELKRLVDGTSGEDVEF